MGPTPDASPTDELSWSPGQQIVFTANRDGRQQIYRVDFDGGNLNLSNSPSDFAADWCPAIET